METGAKDKNTAEYVVARLFENWIKKDWEEVNRYVQTTWLYRNGIDGFKNMFGSIDVAGYHIYGKEAVTDCRHEVDFRADIIFKGKVVMRYGKANCICETAEYTSGPKGIWGVNPISLLRWRK